MTAAALAAITPVVPLLPARTASNVASMEATYTIIVRCTLGDLIDRLGDLPLLYLRKNNLVMLNSDAGPSRGAQPGAAGNGAGPAEFSGAEKECESARNISQPFQRPDEIVCAMPNCANTRKVAKQGALPKWCPDCAKIVKQKQDKARRAAESEERTKALKRGAPAAMFA